MSWRNIHLIFLREVRDQLRDRRTLFMIVVLPLLLYPALGIGIAWMKVLFTEQARTVVVLGTEHLPDQPPLIEDGRFISSWFEVPQDAETLELLTDSISDETPNGGERAKDAELRDLPGSPPADLKDEIRDAESDSRRRQILDQARVMRRLLAEHRELEAAQGRALAPLPAASGSESGSGGRQPLVETRRLTPEARQGAGKGARDEESSTEVQRIEKRLRHVKDRLSALFSTSGIQVLIVVPEGFARRIETVNRLIAERDLQRLPEAASGAPDRGHEEPAGRPEEDGDLRSGQPQGQQAHAERENGSAEPDSPRLIVVRNTADEKSLIAYSRVNEVLRSWEQEILKRRLLGAHLPESLPNPVDPEPVDLAQEEQRSANIWSKVFPLVLVLMAVTGAFYPAVDLAAGEKERGTMETLLICPATRSEIVMGKFGTIMGFSLVTAILNLVSIVISGKFMVSIDESGVLERFGDLPVPGPATLAWVFVLLLPLAALFSALCLALATFARSSKEGQYYLTPLLIVTVLLTTFCLLPGVEITPFYSILPIAGPTLLLRTLLASPGPTDGLIYAIPVLVTSIGYSLLALWWAIDQFGREEVLFREAERFDLRLWARHLLRDKEPAPSFAEAGFCFVLIMMLQFAALKFFRAPITEVGPSGSGSLMMRLLLIQQLALIATPALMMGIILTTSFVRTFRLHRPSWRLMAVAGLLPLALHPLSLELSGVLQESFFPPLPRGFQEVFAEMGNPDQPLWLVLLAFAAVPALCEELAFRGFILSGFGRSGRMWLAIGLSSLAFGIMHMIPQQVFNATLLGVVLGVLAVRSGSLFPAILFHVLYNSLAVGHARLGAHWVQNAPLGETGSLISWFAYLEDGSIRYAWPTLAIAAVVAILLLRGLMRSIPCTRKSPADLSSGSQAETLSKPAGGDRQDPRVAARGL